jgi:hypothetical protein
MLHRNKERRPMVSIAMQSNAAILTATNEIQQHHVDLAADDLLARGVRPTLLKVQQVIGGNRLMLVRFLEDWARRLHNRIAGASMDKTDLDVMRQADSIRKSMLRGQQLDRKKANDVKISQVEPGKRRKELLGETQTAEHKLQGQRERAQEIRNALAATEANIAMWEARLKTLSDELQTIPPA